MVSAHVNEKLRWPWWLFILVIVLDISIVIAIWAGLGNAPAVISVVLVFVLTIAFYFFTGLNIRVIGEVLFVGRAHIEKEHIGEIEILSADQMKYLYGAGLDPAAFLAIRFWVKGGIKLTVRDPRDPTPYWLISSQQPERIQAAIKG